MTRASLAACLALCALLIQIAPNNLAAGADDAPTPAPPERKSKCSPARELEMDTCAAKMGFLGDHSFRVPRNSSAMDAFCVQLKDSIGCIQSYSRDCLQGLTKQILTNLLKEGKQQFASICQSAEARASFMSKMSCLHGDKIAQFHTCMDASIARFELIKSGAVQPDARLPSLCCSYQLFFADTGRTLERLCGPKSETGQFVHKLATGTAGKFIQLMCDGHRNLDQCRDSAKTRESVAKLEQVTKSVRAGKTRPKAKSLIAPLLEILNSAT